MADELPPLEPMPESNISPEMIGQLEHSAQWASTFGGGDTNIALRARHNTDISDYANALAAQRQTAQTQALQNDKNAQNLFFGMARMNLQEQEAQQRMAHAAELHPLKVQAQQAQVAADLAREKASVTSALTQSAKAQALAEAQATADSDTLKFVNGEAQLAKQFGRGTDAYHEGLLDLHVATPAGDQQFKTPYVSAAIKSAEKKDGQQVSTGFIGTPEEARDKYGPSAKLHETAKGIWTVTIPSEAQDSADRAVIKQSALNGLKPTQQDIVDNLVAKKKALNELQPTNEEKINFEVRKQQALNATDSASLVPKPGYIVGHYVEDSAGKSHAVFIPDPALKQGRAEQQDTYAKFDKELKAMVEAYGDESKVPASEWARFEARKKSIAAPPAAAPDVGKDFGSADEVRAAFRAGTLPREQAEAILKSRFGHS